MPLTDAVEGYDLFDKMKIQKGMQPSGKSKLEDELSADTRMGSGFRSTKVMQIHVI